MQALGTDGGQHSAPHSQTQDPVKPLTWWGLGFLIHPCGQQPLVPGTLGKPCLSGPGAWAGHLLSSRKEGAGVGTGGAPTTVPKAAGLQDLLDCSRGQKMEA